MPVRSLWCYHFSHEELIEIFLDAGGSLGDYDKSDGAMLHHARRAIFQYLMPGDVHVWYGALDGLPGVIFIPGKPNIELKSISKGLLARCDDMFLRAPDQYTRVHDPDLELATLSREQDGKTHTLELYFFLESNLDPEDYPRPKRPKHEAPPA